MAANSLELGTWNVICDVCGIKYKANEVKKRWDGLIVCDDDWETRHPQEFVRAVPDQPKLPFTRPEPVDVFVEVTYIEDSVGVQSNDIPTGHFKTNNETL